MMVFHNRNPVDGALIRFTFMSHTLRSREKRLDLFSVLLVHLVSVQLSTYFGNNLKYLNTLTHINLIIALR